MMTPLGSAGELQKRVREVVVEESNVRAVGGEVGTANNERCYRCAIVDLNLFTILQCHDINGNKFSKVASLKVSADRELVLLMWYQVSDECSCCWCCY